MSLAVANPRGGVRSIEPNRGADKRRFGLGRWLLAAVTVLAGLAVGRPANADAQVSTTSGPFTFTTTNQTFYFAHTVSGATVNGSERVLALGVASQSVANNLSSYAVLTATWIPAVGPQQAFTSRVVRPETAQAHRTRTEIWTLRDPVGGPGVISCTLQSNADIVAGASTLVNIDPNAPLTVAGNELSSGGSISVTIASTAGGIVFDNIADDRIRTLVPTAPQAQRWMTGHNGTITGGASTKAAVSASTTMTWTGVANGDKGGLVAISFGGVSGTTAVKLDSFTAAQSGPGTQLNWNTGWESNNLGFNVYRQDGGERTKINDSLIAGGAIASRGQLSAGDSYSWFDAGVPAEAYWLQDVDLNGRRTWHGPFKPHLRADPLPVVRSATFKDLSLTGSGGSAQARSAGSNLKRKGDKNTQSQLAGMPAIKIGVKDDGWYRVSSDQLAGLGLSKGVNSRLLRLFVEGREVPIHVADGGDGRFGAGDSIYFYGVALDTVFSGEQIYWLTVGPGAGLRIATARGGAGVQAASFPYTAELREQVYYLSAVLNGDGNNYFGQIVYGTGTDQKLNLASVAPVQAVKPVIEVKLQGLTADEKVSPDHKVAVYLNGTQVGQILFDGIASGVLSTSVSPSLLLEGSNNIKLVPLAGQMDISFVESIRLTYSRNFIAEDSTLRFAAKGGPVNVAGFETPDVQIIDVTDPEAPRFLNTSVVGSAGSFTASAAAPGQSELLALTAAGVKSPSSIALNTPSKLGQLAQSASLLVIAPKAFHSGLQSLKALRQSQGIATMVIDVEDIYDEFSFGAKSAYAIQDFLAQAKKNAPKNKGPRYVLLVGDASYDPRNFVGYGHEDVVPTKLVDTTYLETASDDWFVDFNGDGIPDLAIGRLPAQSVEQVNLMVAKIVTYENGGSIGGTLLVADQGAEFSFEGASDALQGLIPGQTADKIYRSQGGTKAALVSALNQGSSLVNYVGHGSAHLWPGLLTSDDILGLTNGARLPFVVAMNCFNGRFQNPLVTTVAEAFLKAPQGGAVAVWTSSGQCEPEGQAKMNEALLKTLFSSSPILSQKMTLGEAAMRAKSATSDSDVRRTWIFFGDPTTRLH